MAAETKQEKLNRIPSGSITQQPIPPWPQLPKSFYDRHPEDKAALDAYTAAIEDYFKKRSNRES